ncbi:peptide-methionine (R)-S-oxide reductase MsrB [Flavobacteriaceae bacterium XHP0103]|uniref:peptide-methionine (R)-S-oxide reductase MsrB n=1 Tax=Marixanthotalea marina TaxID=2844359 RepID=UPI002989D91B|nr:peptide-methionine (R)-S-oxide reductase MsrB [Marixanthotalea marina]MBU3822347.1 peptide-methionine (R)-S-oxide reductase MsrB [Marixanthotalea marina]
MKNILLICISLVLLSCKGNAQKSDKKESSAYKVTKTEAEWKAQLTPIEYYVLREEGTERAFTSPLNSNYKEGTYVCKACNTPLFKSEHKFDSGTGWPSFDREIKDNVAFSSGGSEYYGIEEHCAVCGGHLGHVFNDGPKSTTGKRHCINGVALKFIPKNE